MSYTPSHPPQYRAEQAEAADQQALQLALQEAGARPCPACGVPSYPRQEGECDHATCNNCGHQFCFLCCVDRRVLLAHANHYHKRDCKCVPPLPPSPVVCV